jgi:hypothetical protein
MIPTEKSSLHIPLKAGMAALGVLGAALMVASALPAAAGHAAVTSASRPARASGSSGRTTGARTSRSAVAVKSVLSASVGPLETVIETLNNCGPASVSSVLAYWHIDRTQAQVQAILRADDGYWGMSPVGLPAYARSLGMRALVGYGGTEKLVKLLIANGFPVIASQYVSGSDPIRHYRPIEAYSDRTQTFTSADPLLGAGHVISYAEFNAIWAESDGRFQVIYPASLQGRLNAVLRAAGWNKQASFRGAIRWEQAQMQTGSFNVAGSWIWYNGYADVAFDEAQIGGYARAERALAAARRQGVSPVLISWVAGEIRYLRSRA